MISTCTVLPLLLWFLVWLKKCCPTIRELRVYLPSLWYFSLSLNCSRLYFKCPSGDLFTHFFDQLLFDLLGCSRGRSEKPPSTPLAMWSLAVVRNCVPILNAVNWTKSKVFPQSDKRKNLTRRKTNWNSRTHPQIRQQQKTSWKKREWDSYFSIFMLFLSSQKKKSAHKNSMNEQPPKMWWWTAGAKWMNEWEKNRFSLFYYFISKEGVYSLCNWTRLWFSALLVLLWRDKWKRNTVRW